MLGLSDPALEHADLLDPLHLMLFVLLPESKQLLLILLGDLEDLLVLAMRVVLVLL